MLPALNILWCTLTYCHQYVIMRGGMIKLQAARFPFTSSEWTRSFAGGRNDAVGTKGFSVDTVPLVPWVRRILVDTGPRVISKVGHRDHPLVDTVTHPLSTP